MRRLLSNLVAAIPTMRRKSQPPSGVCLQPSQALFVSQLSPQQVLCRRSSSSHARSCSASLRSRSSSSFLPLQLFEPLPSQLQPFIRSQLG